MEPATHKNRPFVALRALRQLLADPDDLPKVFTVIDSLPGRAPEYLLSQTQRSPAGARLLAAKPQLASRLCDREALRALPVGSLGRHYLEFVESQGISAEGIAEASELGGRRPENIPANMRYLGDRLRDAHDLWHVVTGYGPDLVGEGALLAFTFAQTKNPGILTVVLLGLAKFDSAGRADIFAGYRAGQRAAWLPAFEWETWLARPLEEVRAELKVSQARYQPVTSAELRSSGVLAAKPS